MDAERSDRGPSRAQLRSGWTRLVFILALTLFRERHDNALTLYAGQRLHEWAFGLAQLGVAVAHSAGRASESVTKMKYTDVKQQVKVGARAGATAPVSSAHMMTGLGSAPVGRWQGPGRDCWSRRCGRSGEAREARFGINLSSRK